MNDMFESCIYAVSFQTYRYKRFDDNKTQVKAVKSILPLILETQLTERQQECMELCYNQGLNQAQIAQKLHITQGTVSRHLAAAKKITGSYLKYALLASQRAVSMVGR